MLRKILMLVLAAAVLVPAGSAPAVPDQGSGALPPGNLAVGTEVLPPASTTFDPSHLVWARGTRLRDAGAVHDLAPWRILQIQRSPFGFFLRVSRSYVDGYRLAWFDGKRITWVGSATTLPEISPDGRLAGWVDHEGPRIEHGRAGRIIVADLVTGKVVFSTSRWMGDDTDIYEEIYPEFLGFDSQYAYWQRVTGSPERVRTDLVTWETSPAATLDEGLETPIGLPTDPYTGTRVTLGNGVPSHDPFDGEPGFVSADGRFAFNLSRTARLEITDAATGARIDPDWGSRWRWFAGWKDADTAYIALPRRYDYTMWGPRDRIRVRVAACDLPAGGCTTVLRTRGLHHMVFGSGSAEAY